MPVVRVLVGGSGVDQNVGPEIADQPLDQSLVSDGAFHEGQPIMAFRQMDAAASLEIVDGEHLVAALQMKLSHMRTDLTASAGHKNLHPVTPSISSSACLSRALKSTRLNSSH